MEGPYIEIVEYESGRVGSLMDGEFGVAIVLAICSLWHSCKLPYCNFSIFSGVNPPRSTDGIYYQITKENKLWCTLGPI